MSDVALAADLGGTNLRMAAVDREGQVRNLVKHPVPKDVSPAGLMEMIGQMADSCRCDNANVSAVGFTAPAPVPKDFDGVLTKLPNLPSITGMNFRAELEKLFGLRVTIENDATAAAIGEHWIGASQGLSTSVVITLGTGIGGGIIINGEPLRGLDGIGGEIGHMTVEPDGRP
ncbi:MAG: ROK family protein, partial [Acidobacteriota bacterium]